MPRDLAPVYLDNQPVLLMGDPHPRVRKILASGGARARQGAVRWLRDLHGLEGIRLDPDDVLDRTRTDEPIYLTRLGSAPGPPRPLSPLAAAEPPWTVAELGQAAIRIGSGSGGASQFRGLDGLEDKRAPGVEKRGAPTHAEFGAPGVSGEGNEAGSPQSTYARTQNGEQAGENPPIPPPPRGHRRRDFGREGIPHPARRDTEVPPAAEPSGLGATRPVRLRPPPQGGRQPNEPSGAATDPEERRIRKRSRPARDERSP